MRVVITGAAGQIGRQIVEELWDRHDLCLIDRRPVSGRRSVVADLARNRARSYRKPWLKDRLPRWMRMFEGADVAVHLAAYLRHDNKFPEVLRDNIQATWNVLEAAVRYRVPRVVFASSNWVVKGLEMELAPTCYGPKGPKIDSDAAPQPITLYGVSKAFGETAGRALVGDGQLGSFVSVRIGHYNSVPPSKDELRRRWIGSIDIRNLFRHCVEAEFGGFHVVYGVSAQATAPYDLSDTSRLLSWKPEQVLDSESMSPASNLKR